MGGRDLLKKGTAENEIPPIFSIARFLVRIAITNVFVPLALLPANSQISLRLEAQKPPREQYPIPPSTNTV